jgi:hypothetical protein
MMDTTTPVIPTGARAFLAGVVEESAEERRMIQSTVLMVADSSTPLRSARNDVRLRGTKQEAIQKIENRNKP